MSIKCTIHIHYILWLLISGSDKIPQLPFQVKIHIIVKLERRQMDGFPIQGNYITENKTTWSSSQFRIFQLGTQFIKHSPLNFPPPTHAPMKQLLELKIPSWLWAHFEDGFHFQTKSYWVVESTAVNKKAQIAQVL